MGSSTSVVAVVTPPERKSLVSMRLHVLGLSSSGGHVVCDGDVEGLAVSLGVGIERGGGDKTGPDREKGRESKRERYVVQIF